MADQHPVYVIKKKGGHAGHHGGAWKVAYADFVTAMMALFIVLWLLNTSKQVQEAVGGYFKDPTGTSKMVGNGQNGSGENFTLTKDNMSQLKDELQTAIRKTANFEKIKDHIEMTITSEGLRVELMESGTGDNFFQRGVAVPTESGKDILVKLAGELGKLPNLISIEGHTDAKPFASGRGYGNWELSADRANAARRIMQDAGLRTDQVSQMRGFADRRPRENKGPEDDSNRRVTVIVQYQVKPGENAPGTGGEPAKGEGEAKPAAAGGHAPEAPSGKPAGH